MTSLLEISFTACSYQIGQRQYFVTGAAHDVGQHMLQAVSNSTKDPNDLIITELKPPVSEISPLTSEDKIKMQNRYGIIFLAVVLKLANYSDFGISETE